MHALPLSWTLPAGEEEKLGESLHPDTAASTVQVVADVMLDLGR